jgi:iron complex outermembrane receptor protein
MNTVHGLSIASQEALQPCGARAPAVTNGALLAAAIALALSLHATPARAQTTAGQEDTLAEVVITAQHREETMQHVGIPVAALTASDLQDAGVTTTADLTRLVPSVQIYSGGQGSTQAALRGVGNLAGNTYAEQAVAFSLDGSYIPRGESIGGNFFDLERVEVLKGPQGTLYGRNSNAGAINLITKKPVIGKMGVDLQAEGGNYGHYGIEGAVNLVTGDTSALRVSGQRIAHNGYFSDGYNDQDETAARASWLWKPVESVSLLVSTDTGRVGGMGTAAGMAPATGNFWDGPSTPGQQKRWLAAGAYPVQADGYVRIQNHSTRAQLDWVTSAGTLTVLPSYRTSEEHARHYAAGFAVDFDQNSTAKSAEVRFATPSDRRASGIVGAYYFNESAGFTLTAHQLGGNPDGSVNPGTSFMANNIIPVIDTDSKAVFGQGTLKFTDTLRLVAGARYTKESKSTSGLTKAAPVPVFGFVPFTPISNKLDASKTTGKVGLEYDVRPQSLVYLSYSTGFKAGGFFASPGGTFKPEELTAITLGAKNRFLGDTLQFNVEAYHWKYKDKQISHLGFLPSGAVDLVTDNAGNATLYGIEPELIWLVGHADRLNLSVQYEHSRYDDFRYSSPAPAPGPGGCTNSAGPPPFTIDCSGKPVPNAPEWTGVAGYAHTATLGNGGSLVADLSVQYRSSTVSGEEQLPVEKNKSYTMEDFFLTYNHPGDKWSMTAYVYNLSDEHVTQNSFFWGGTPNGVGPVGAMTAQGAPRTYGLRVNAKF